MSECILIQIPDRFFSKHLITELSLILGDFPIESVSGFVFRKLREESLDAPSDVLEKIIQDWIFAEIFLVSCEAILQIYLFGLVCQVLEAVPFQSCKGYMALVVPPLTYVRNQKKSIFLVSPKSEEDSEDSNHLHLMLMKVIFVKHCDFEKFGLILFFHRAVDVFPSVAFFTLKN